jgi:hypothetical protein
MQSGQHERQRQAKEQVEVMQSHRRGETKCRELRPRFKCGPKVVSIALLLGLFAWPCDCAADAAQSSQEADARSGIGILMVLIVDHSDRQDGEIEIPELVQKAA